MNDSFPFRAELERLLAKLLDDLLSAEERARLEKKLQDTVSFLDCIDNRMIKRAVELKVIDGLSWQQIVNRFGNVLTEAALLMRTKRELEKI